MSGSCLARVSAAASSSHSSHTVRGHASPARSSIARGGDRIARCRLVSLYSPYDLRLVVVSRRVLDGEQEGLSAVAAVPLGWVRSGSGSGTRGRRARARSRPRPRRIVGGIESRTAGGKRRGAKSREGVGIRWGASRGDRGETVRRSSRARTSAEHRVVQPSREREALQAEPEPLRLGEGDAEVLGHVLDREAGRVVGARHPRPEVVDRPRAGRAGADRPGRRITGEHHRRALPVRARGELMRRSSALGRVQGGRHRTA